MTLIVVNSIINSGLVVVVKYKCYLQKEFNKVEIGGEGG